jgi:hypothetical protein
MLAVANKGTFVVAMAGLALSLVAQAGRARTQSAAVQWRSLSSQQAPAPSGKTAEQVYKNIQVLNGLPASELDGVMDFMSASLGVGCTHCHTNPWDSDAKSTKVGARRMIVMMRAINKENFSGNPAITCYTCHRGQHNTEPLPPADLPTTLETDVTTTANKPSALPSTDVVIARYMRAIGGDAAIGSLKTRTSRGTETTTNRMTAPQKLQIEILQAAPTKLLIARNDPRGATLEGFDGSKGWTKDLGGQREITGKKLVELKRLADFFRYLKIRESYPQMRVLAKENVRDREAYVVGATSRSDSREKLYFDVESGLLVRQFVAFKTAFGSIPEVTDFDDYREVSGVKLPFTITWSRPPFSSTLHFAEIRLNAIIDESRFELRAR